MAYSEEDLGLFAILRDSRHLDGTAYFELHPGEIPEQFTCWLQESIFIRDAGFDFLVECFCRANPRFDYFEFVRFDLSQLEGLSAELSAFLKTLASGCRRDIVFTNYQSLFSRELWKNVPTESLPEAVSQATARLLEFVQQTRAEQKPLWVLGM